MANFYVYILANKKDGVLYIGLKKELERRLEEHTTKRLKGFTYKYNIDKLMYFEEFDINAKKLLREKED